MMGETEDGGHPDEGQQGSFLLHNWKLMLLIFLGAVVLVIVVLALIGPAIGNIYTDDLMLL